MILGKDLVPLAEQAVARAIEDLAGDPGPRLFLHRSRHISFHLPELDSVARVRPLSASETLESLQRELDVVAYLMARDAPVVPPCPRFAAEPHLADGFAMTFWQFVEHQPLDWDSPGHRATALMSLESLHEALADYPGYLPNYRLTIDDCSALLNREDSMPALVAEDRALLKAAHAYLVSRLETFDIKARPIHGDVHSGNIFMTADGPLWSDFEAASLGPAEWDTGGLKDVGEDDEKATTLPSVLSDLRGFCVAVWCWDLAHMPEKLEAALYHTGRLQAKYADLV